MDQLGQRLSLTCQSLLMLSQPEAAVVAQEASQVSPTVVAELVVSLDKLQPKSLSLDKQSQSLLEAVVAVKPLVGQPQSAVGQSL